LKKLKAGYMPNEIAKDLAESNWSLVLAPAGCGKTHLISDSVKTAEGRQLILTHTHAGVRAMIDHLKRNEVPSSQYSVSTIDSVAMKYACAFPLLSGWNNKYPSGDDWNLICPAASAALKMKAVKKVFTSTYSGIFVDEYQDCSTSQHEFISLIADYLPCRVLGDPMQSIFWEVNKKDSLNWKNVESTFHHLATLSIPWRWKNANEPLGEWLLHVRDCLENGQPFDLRDGPVNWKNNAEHRYQVKACYESLRNKGQTVVAIQKWANQCHKLARYLRNTFSSMETVECIDLLNYSTAIEESEGYSKVAVFADFIKKCVSGLPQGVKTLLDTYAKGRSANPRRPDFRSVASSLQQIASSNDLSEILKAMISIEGIEEHIVIARRELWNEMKKTLKSHGQHPCSLMERAWGIRDIGRKVGRKIQNKCVATTLLVKGLEFDHAIILDANGLDNAENLYVAMTRGCNSLTILSSIPILQRDRPRHLI
jgi:DNA helicase-2/ATP-dependent DNA helicase PcrA